MKQETSLPVGQSEHASAESEPPAWLRYSAKILAAHKALFILVAGCGFLLAENVGRIASLLPTSIPDLKSYYGSLLALLIVLLGIAGLSWGRCAAFFQRWGRNHEPIFWDSLFPGAAAGIFLHFLRKSACEGVWQTWWLIPLLAIGSICIWRAQKLTSNQTQPAPARSGRILSDEPLAELTPETDAFGRLPFAGALADAVCRNDPTICHVIGLVGPWGSGKSTILPAVSARCQSAGFRAIAIDAWAFRETGRLTEAVLTKIVKDIDQRYVQPKLRRTLARYLSIISPLVSKVPVLDALSRALAGADELDNLKNSLAAAVQATQDRFLVIIDDVDRLDAAEFQSLVKTVRLCASIPRIVYILADDRASIYRLIAKEDAPMARDFMDKVVEDEWVIPLIPRDKLLDYIKSHCVASLAERTPRFARDFEERLVESLPALRQLLRTPRHIKRAGISLSRRFTLLARLNPFDAFLWQVLRQREPALYEFVTQHPWLLRPDRGQEVDWAIRRLADKECRKNEIATIDKCIDETSENAQVTKDLFWALFAREERITEAAEAKEIRLRRISNSLFFDAYFLLESGEDAARPDQIDALVAVLNAADSPQSIHDRASQAMGSALKEEWISTWISLIAVFSEDLKPATIYPIVDAIREFQDHHVDPTSRESGELARSLVGLNAQLVAHLPTDAEATAAVADLLTKTAALAIAGHYALLLERDSYGYGEKHLDIQNLCAVFDNRLEKELMRIGAAVFQQPGAVLGTLIYYYSNKTKLWEFITTAAGNDSTNWAKFIMQFVLLWENGLREVNLKEVHKVPRPLLQHAFDLLSQADLSKLSTYEQQAAQTFIKWWPDGQIGQAPPPLANPNS
jgi:hypothetical protein